MAVRLSIRWRLTLWNASVLAVLLVSFAYVGWLTLAYSVHEHGDETLIETANAVARAVVAERNAARARGEVTPAGRAAARSALRERSGDLDIVIADDEERVVAATRRSRGGKRGAPLVPPIDSLQPAVREMMREARPTGPPILRTIKFDDGIRRATAVRLAFGKGDAEPALIVGVLRSIEDDEALLQRTRNILLLAIPFALVVSGIAGYALARRSLAPVEAMAQQASLISAANLEARLPVVNTHDEIGRLATVINALLARVDDAFRRQRLFVAEASHELRTPIAIMRGEADVTLQRSARDESEYRESLEVIRDETTRLTRIVNDLFLLASADAGAPLDLHMPVDVIELLQGALRSVRSIADAHGVRLIGPELQSGTPAPTVLGDATLLRRLVLNLLDNALKHLTTGGTIEVSCAQHDQQVTVVVADDGPGVPPELRKRIFDRFVRGSGDRARLDVIAMHGGNGNGHANGNGSATSAGVAEVASGAGLGLAIAAAIATVHRGRLSIDDNGEQRGASFRLVLPAA